MPDPTLREQLRALGVRHLSLSEDLESGAASLSYVRRYACCGVDSDLRQFEGTSGEALLAEALAHEQAMDAEEAGRPLPCCGEGEP